MLARAAAAGAFLLVAALFHRSIRRRAAQRDPVTGLDGPGAFGGALAEALKSAALGHESVVLVLATACRFKDLQRPLGHAAAEEVLSELGRHVRAPLGDDDVVARLDRGTFAVLLRHHDPADRAPEVARQLAGTFELVSLLGRHIPIAVDAAIVTAHPGSSERDVRRALREA